jgi:hypothetical protein
VEDSLSVLLIGTSRLRQLRTLGDYTPNVLSGAGGGLSALGYRFSKADIGVRCVDGSFVAAAAE